MIHKCMPAFSIGVFSVALAMGCATSEPFVDFESSIDLLSDSQQTEYTEVSPVSPAVQSVVAVPEPFSIRDTASPNWIPPQPWNLTYEEVVQIALANSTVLRDLGARVVQAPALTPTIYGPSIQATDAQFGIEAALSAFDAQMTGNLFFEDNDRVLNNELFGGGVNFFRQDLSRFQSALSKQSATGTIFSLRHNVDGDLNNALQNIIDGRAWSWNLESEIRHPLLQGRGALFNRIAGPNGTPGVYNGVLIARLNANISVAQLEMALRDYLSNVENAYWDLYFAYAEFNVKKQARDRSLDMWTRLKARQGVEGAETDKLAQAKEQYYRFEEEVQDALGGRLLTGTRSFNGSGGGTFQGIGGIYASERKLRWIMGLPINDGRLIHPATQPSAAPTQYDWNELVGVAMSRRTELRTQQLTIERRQLELTASQNFTLPRLDALATYRYRGLGDRLYDPHVFDSARGNVGSDTHEWMLGLNLSYPLGYRQAHSAVRNAELQLARERALLTEIERRIVYGLSDAMADVDRGYKVLGVATNRYNAAYEQWKILTSEARDRVGRFDFNALLDSERRLAEAHVGLHRARVQYELATKNLNFEMGTLLEYFNIHLAEGNWPRRELPSAHRAPRMLDYVIESIEEKPEPASIHMTTQEISTTTQETPTANQEILTATQETPTAPQEIPTATQETPTAPQEIPTATQEIPMNPIRLPPLDTGADRPNA